MTTKNSAQTNLFQTAEASELKEIEKKKQQLNTHQVNSFT